MMAEQPILFSGRMVRAILAGQKTQTRRTDKRQNDGPYFGVEDGQAWRMDDAGQPHPRPCPYGGAGDRLWVRETWRECEDGRIEFAADNPDCDGLWRSPIFLPRSASRITLEITSTRIERLQEITDADVIAEGFAERADFVATWNDLHGEGAWKLNPWVWVIEFARIVNA